MSAYTCHISDCSISLRTAVGYPWCSSPLHLQDPELVMSAKPTSIKSSDRLSKRLLNENSNGLVSGISLISEGMMLFPEGHVVVYSELQATPAIRGPASRWIRMRWKPKRHSLLGFICYSHLNQFHSVFVGGGAQLRVGVGLAHVQSIKKGEIQYL